VKSVVVGVGIDVFKANSFHIGRELLRIQIKVSCKVPIVEHIIRHNFQRLFLSVSAFQLKYVEAHRIKVL
jgi:hypothetical protein